jgi:hypothetical protein
MAEAPKASQEVQTALDKMSNAIWELKGVPMCADDQETYDGTIERMNDILSEIYKVTGAAYSGYNWKLAGKDPKDVM